MAGTAYIGVGKGRITKVNLPELVWCPECEEMVEPEGGLDATGLYSVCPICGMPLE